MPLFQGSFIQAADARYNLECTSIAECYTNMIESGIDLYYVRYDACVLILFTLSTRMHMYNTVTNLLLNMRGEEHQGNKCLQTYHFSVSLLQEDCNRHEYAWKVSATMLMVIPGIASTDNHF